MPCLPENWGADLPIGTWQSGDCHPSFLVKAVVLKTYFTANMTTNSLGVTDMALLPVLQ